VALRTRALAALAVCFDVESSQQFHTPMLDAIRRTVPGHLVLGSGYDPRDFVAYAAGVFAAGPPGAPDSAMSDELRSVLVGTGGLGVLTALGLV